MVSHMLAFKYLLNILKHKLFQPTFKITNPYMVGLMQLVEAISSNDWHFVFIGKQYGMDNDKEPYWDMLYLIIRNLKNISPIN
jgi:citrate lyase synthetase